jgi:hypothetical protein
MIKHAGFEYLVQRKHMEKIVCNMQNTIPKCTPIMVDCIVKRALYKVNNSEGDKSKWIRIMEGDIERIGETRCTITYKDRKRDMSGETYALLKVDNFEDATHLFEVLQYEHVSYQEHKRSKFACVLDNVKYIVRFDIWPKIEDIVFVGIDVASSTKEDDVDGFLNALGIKDLVEDSYLVDVDKEYKERIGKAASEIPIITFESFSPIE